MTNSITPPRRANDGNTLLKRKDRELQKVMFREKQLQTDLPVVKVGVRKKTVFFKKETVAGCNVAGDKIHPGKYLQPGTTRSMLGRYSNCINTINS